MTSSSAGDARQRGRGAAVVGLVVLVIAGGCSGSAPAPGVTLGALYPLSGPQSVEGRQEANGVELAVEWKNDHGGIGGHHIRLLKVDAPKAEAVPAAMAALAGDGVSVVLGSQGSAISAAGADAAATDGMLLWETGAVGEVDANTGEGRSFFRLAPMGANLGRAGLAFVRDQLAPTLAVGRPLRYAVAYVDDPYGRAVGRGAVDEATSSGQQLVGTFAYDTAATDYADLARRIAASHPDVLFVSAYLDDGVALRQALVAAKTPLLVNIGTSSSYCMPAFGDRLGNDAVGLFASDKPDAAAVRPDALRPEARPLLAWAAKHYRDRYHEAMSAPALAGFSNALALVDHVLPAAAGTTPAAVATAALATKLAPGSLPNGGGLDLAPPGAPDAGENRAAASVIWEWVAPGQRAVVWPAAYATHAVTPPVPAGR